MREIYLDHAATSPMREEAKEALIRGVDAWPGNPSSLHRKGFEAEKALTKAREEIADTLRAKPREIIFTSGGTEANNLALFSGARRKKARGSHILIGGTEHAAVRRPCEALQKEGFTVDILPVEKDGSLRAETVLQALREDTVLVSIMHVNNEIGTIYPIEEIGRRLKAERPDILFHTDAIQSYGKIPISPRESGIDLLSVSGHKIGAIRGTGFLYKAEEVFFDPLIYGGGQEGGLRSGTEGLPSILSLAAAAKVAAKEMEERKVKMKRLRSLLLEGVASLGGSFLVHGGDHAIDSILGIAFPGVRSEVLLHALEDKGIYIGAGSACSTHHRGISPVLQAIGAPRESHESTVRFSFGMQTTEEDIQYTVEALRSLLPMLRLFVRK